MKTKLALTLLCALAIPGCYMDLGSGSGGIDEPLTPRGSTPFEVNNDLNVTQPQIEGRLGDFSANGEGYVANAYGDGNWANIDIRVRGDRGVIMNALNIEGGLDSLEVGQTYRSSARDYDAPAGLYFSMVGCSGPSDNVWEYDRSADEIEVSVEEGPEEGTIELFYNASFEDGSASRGSFVMAN
ncbi:MAG: hypothetical protein ACI9KE_001297 [Polyangiales bacterium]|jgi:hypothetical protein